MSENMEEMQEIIQDFLVEADELLEELDEDLVRLENESDDEDLLNKIFRAFHTIKGSASFLGFEKLTELTHKLEDVLNRLRKFEIHLDTDMMDAILAGVDKAKIIIDAIKNGEDPEAIDIVENIEQLKRFLDENYSHEKVRQPKEDVEEEQGEELTEEELIKAQEQEMIEEEGISPEEGEGKSSDDIDAEIERLLAWRMEEDKKRRMQKKQQQEGELPKEIEKDKKEDEDKKDKEEALKENQVKQRTKTAVLKKTKPVIEQTIRVDVERLDDLMNLVGELVLGKNRLVSVTQRAEEKFGGDEIVEELSEVASQITLVTTDLQMGVMKTRMVQIGKVFNKFPRVVRDIARELNKEVELVIKGAETELDKSVVEEINDPLVHIVRNAIDHGIEPPDERKKIGKPSKGKVVLSAYHEGNYIVIETSDDGKGMDPEKLKQKALEKGLITETEARQMSKEEAYALIFKPGFSTASSVTNISGRGVGMDVVKTNVEKLNGIIEVKSEVGKGTTIILKIPLTLAIIQALLVKVAKEFFAVPLVSVVETVRISKNDIDKVENKDVLRLRDNIIPLVYLGDTLGIGENKRTLDGKEIYVVVVAVAEKRIGLIVDELIGREEIVIKSLGNYLTNIKGISGATIMGDGSVTLILDVANVVNEASIITTNIEDHLIELYEKEKPVVLIAARESDMNKELKKYLKDRGYEVVSAHTDKEALDLACEHIADLVMVDLGIYISDGYNLAKTLRGMPAYKSTPIIGISTDGTFDKEKLKEAKINKLIFAPFTDDELTTAIEAASKKNILVA
ncbi:hybrid sensor histidine kinase/response regulator [Hippea maritima]|uniref:histidine kinase n=1 Tax=Hippea maritima (strain ATCC 700847 / DSM 10411 / MH2) TaxID=760142 RepID=F2LTK4_HIPMA|nr:hybrid sensor histidine kinase/response regulator [Hippea maritima]AEA33329.1 CheA signal transduction histidine kinase [Hippea maritima DSM 10411]